MSVWKSAAEWPRSENGYLIPKIQQTKMLVTCQRCGDLFLFGLVWQYSSIQKNIIKVGAKSWMLTCSCHITLSLPFYTDPDLKRELNFCNGYLSLLYFWKYRFRNTKLPTLAEKNPKQIDLINTPEPMSIPIDDQP